MESLLRKLRSIYPYLQFEKQRGNNDFIWSICPELTAIEISNYFFYNPLEKIYVWYTDTEHLEDESMLKRLCVLKTNDQSEIIRLSGISNEIHSNVKIRNKLRLWEQLGKLRIFYTGKSGLNLKVDLDKIAIDSFAKELADFCPDIWTDFEDFHESDLIKNIGLQEIVHIKKKEFDKVNQDSFLKYRRGLRESRLSAVKAITNHLQKHQTVHIWWD